MLARGVAAATQILLALVVLAAPASAQSTAQLPLQFDFLPPGARSVGMGSAFIAAADDATAAFTNPAGLARLGRREISAELRFKRLATPYLFGGRITGTITNNGLDTIPIRPTGRHRRSVRRKFPLVLLAVGGEGEPDRLSPSGRVTIDNGYFSQGVFERAVVAGRRRRSHATTPVGGTRGPTSVTTVARSATRCLSDCRSAAACPLYVRPGC